MINGETSDTGNDFPKMHKAVHMYRITKSKWGRGWGRQEGGGGVPVLPVEF